MECWNIGYRVLSQPLAISRKLVIRWVNVLSCSLFKDEFDPDQNESP